MVNLIIFSYAKCKSIREKFGELFIFPLYKDLTYWTHESLRIKESYWLQVNSCQMCQRNFARYMSTYLLYFVWVSSSKLTNVRPIPVNKSHKELFFWIISMWLDKDTSSHVRVMTKRTHKISTGFILYIESHFVLAKVTLKIYYCDCKHIISSKTLFTLNIFILLKI